VLDDRLGFTVDLLGNTSKSNGFALLSGVMGFYTPRDSRDYHAHRTGIHGKPRRGRLPAIRRPQVAGSTAPRELGPHEEFVGRRSGLNCLLGGFFLFFFFFESTRTTSVDAAAGSIDTDPGSATNQEAAGGRVEGRENKQPVHHLDGLNR